MKLLIKTPKNDKTVSVYLRDIKKAINVLAAIGATITTEDHIESIQKSTMRLLYLLRLVVILSLLMTFNLSYLAKKNVFKGINLLTHPFELMLLFFTLSIIKPHLFVPISINTLVVVVFHINTQADILNLMDHINFTVILKTPPLLHPGNLTGRSTIF